MFWSSIEFTLRSITSKCGPLKLRNAALFVIKRFSALGNREFELPLPWFQFAEESADRISYVEWRLSTEKRGRELQWLSDFKLLGRNSQI